jgi:hypothetical protein
MILRSQRNPANGDIFGRPNVSRYENYYPAPNTETIETEAKELTDDKAPPPTNPFYVGYEMDELAMLWDVHTTNFGERPSASEEPGVLNSLQDSTEMPDPAGAPNLPASIGAEQFPIKMGLHELIVEACRDADEKKSR